MVAGALQPGGLQVVPGHRGGEVHHARVRGERHEGRGEWTGGGSSSSSSQVRWRVRERRRTDDGLVELSGQ